MRRGAALLVVLAVTGMACSVTTDPRRRLVTYGIVVHPCQPNDCTVPDSLTGITAADRGDTVWVFGFVEGGDPFLGDSALVRLRGECAENLALLDSDETTVRTVPAVVACPDSMITRWVGRPPNPAEYRYIPWVLDSLIPPGMYVLEGRVVVPPPDLRPAVPFEIR